MKKNESEQESEKKSKNKIADTSVGLVRLGRLSFRSVVSKLRFVPYAAQAQ